MLRVLFSLVLFVFITAPVLMADDQKYVGFTKRPVTQAEYAEAIRKNDQSILTSSSEHMLQKFNEQWPELELRSVEELAVYIESLTVVPCLSEGRNHSALLARVERTPRLIDLGGRSRVFEPGEMCGKDNNTGDLIVSFMCGNIVVSTMPVYKTAVGSGAPDVDLKKVPEGAFGATTSDQPSGGTQAGSRGWVSRNKNWAIPTGIVVVATAICAATGCFKMNQKQDVNVTIR